MEDAVKPSIVLPISFGDHKALLAIITRRPITQPPWPNVVLDMRAGLPGAKFEELMKRIGTTFLKCDDLTCIRKDFVLIFNSASPCSASPFNKQALQLHRGDRGIVGGVGMILLINSGSREIFRRQCWFQLTGPWKNEFL